MDDVTVHFLCCYSTTFGQNIVLSLSHGYDDATELANDNRSTDIVIPLAWTPAGWVGKCQLNRPFDDRVQLQISYKYGLVNGSSSAVVFEWGPARCLHILQQSPRHVEARDAWNVSTSRAIVHLPKQVADRTLPPATQAPSPEHVFQAPTVAATLFGRKVLQRPDEGPRLTAVPVHSVRMLTLAPTGVTADWERHKSQQDTAASNMTVQLSVTCARVRPDQRVHVVGGCPALGQWDVAKSPALTDARFPLWEAALSIPPTDMPCEYKFVLTASDGTVVWEEGSNRVLAAPAYVRLGTITSPVRLMAALSRKEGAAGEAGTSSKLRLAVPRQLLNLATQEVMLSRGLPAIDADVRTPDGSPVADLGEGMDAATALAIVAQAGADPEAWVASPTADELATIRDELAEAELDRRRAAAKARREAEAAALARTEAARAHAREAEQAAARAQGLSLVQLKPDSSSGAVVVSPPALPRGPTQIVVVESCAEAPTRGTAAGQGAAASTKDSAGDRDLSTRWSRDTTASSSTAITATGSVQAGPGRSNDGSPRVPTTESASPRTEEPQAAVAIQAGHQQPVDRTDVLSSADAYGSTAHIRRHVLDLAIKAPGPAQAPHTQGQEGVQVAVAGQGATGLSVSGAALAWDSGDGAVSPRPGSHDRPAVGPSTAGVEEAEGTGAHGGPRDATAAVDTAHADGSASAGPGPRPAHAPETMLCISESQPRFSSTPWRGAGVTVPVHALRSHRDHGIGDFAGLRDLVQWASTAGLALVQIPPVNDTHGSGVGTESSPYRAVSAFALHPVYISLADIVEDIQAQGQGQGNARPRHGSVGLPPVIQSPSRAPASPPLVPSDGSSAPPVLPGHLLARIEAARQQIQRGVSSGEGAQAAGDVTQEDSTGQARGPKRWETLLSVRPAAATPASDVHASSGTQFRGGFDASSAALRPGLDYEAAVRTKLGLLRELYRAVGEAHLASPDFATFYAANVDWLQPYALYCVMRELMGSPDPRDWGSRSSISHPSVQALTDPSALHYKAVAHVYWLQYIAHKQLAAVAARAAELGVLLQVELPVGLSPSSADAWSRPWVARGDRRMGSPPDSLAREGAAWTVAPFNWQQHGKEQYSWWKRRLGLLSSYFSGIVLCGADTYFRSYEVHARAATGLAGVYSPVQGLSMMELRSAGLWDVRRLTAPYVREWGARASLGSDFASLAARFFRIREGGVYEFREGVTSEEGIRAALDNTPYKHLAGPLISLLTNVCLLESPEDGPDSTMGGPVASVQPPHPPGYHPRLEFASTTSFLELDDASQAALRRLVGSYIERQRGLWLQAGVSRVAALMQQGPGRQGSMPTLAFAANDLACSKDASEALQHMGVLCVRTHKLPTPGEGPGSGATAGLEPVASGHGRPFSDPSSYPWGTISTTSTLDSLPLRAWWEADPALAAHFYHAVLGTAPPMAPGAHGAAVQQGMAATPPAVPVAMASAGAGMGSKPSDATLSLPRTCTPDISASLVRLHLASPAMWAVFPLQDLLGMDTGLRHPEPHVERACVRSADLRGTYVWRWRCHVAMEELAGEPGRALTAKIRGMVTDTGRQLPRQANKALQSK